MTKKANKLIWAFFGAFLFFFSEISTAAAQGREMTEYPRVRLQSLDKATARTMTFNAKVGSTIKYGPLYIRIKSCQKSSPIDEPESAAFLEIWEVGTDKTSKWVYSGWMFASSPGLTAMDHPIYDVWVIDCLDYEQNADTPQTTLNNDEETPDANQEDQTQQDKAESTEHSDETKPKENQGILTPTPDIEDSAE